MAIGIFDSGSGGLTVMRALEEALPDQPLVYLGDHANAPYGNRSAVDIYELTRRNLDTLFDTGCRLVIVACNTAAATALRPLQRGWLPGAHPDKRVLGVVVPLVEEITGIPWDAEQEPTLVSGQAGPVRVAVFATRQTVASGAFAAEIHKRAPHVEVRQQACPSLVPLIEAGAPSDVLQAAIRVYAEGLDFSPDVCILGCTHYPLVEDLFRQALPAETRILSQPEVTARSLAAYLERHPELRSAPDRSRQFLTTGDPERASALASRFYRRAIAFKTVPK